MNRKLFEMIIIIMLLFVITINIFMLVQIWLLMNTNALISESKTTYILPDGFTPEKTKILWNEALPSPSGWVVRYASKNCIYCKMDFEWERLVPKFEQYNYRTIVLLPDERSQFDEEMIFSENVQQMIYARMDWIKQFRFIGTPTVLIFDNKGHMLWYKSGILKNADYESAEKAILKNTKNVKF